MNPPITPRKWMGWCLLAFGWLVTVLSLQAQGTGTIQGRVYNPATQQYVRNAEVRLEGTNQLVGTENDGSFTLNNVPAGQATITVTYTGYKTVTETLNVTGGQTATREINITSTQVDSGVVQLTAFTVSTEREGNAKAIMEQRRNMNITTSVASDIFGDVTDGNMGEFLKYLPGVDVDYVESETRGPRLGGMDAQYVGVSFDGVKLASADANRTGDLGRATSFEAFSISSIESIEIHRTTSPDMDASSPAGTINMKTRKAFDRKGRRISYNFSLNLNSEEFTLKKTYGPDSNESYKWRPNYSLEISDVFLNNRLGIVASISHADSFTEQYRHNMTYNFTQNPALNDTRPAVLTQLNFKDGAKNIEKDTYTLTADFKATPRLVLSTVFIYNYALGQFFNRELTFQAGNNNANTVNGRSTVVGDVNEVRTTANGLSNVVHAGTNASKRTHTQSFAPRFEYKLDSWTIEGIASYSHSFNNYEGLEKGHTRSEPLNNIQSQWVATRSGNMSHEWKIQQLSGPDWFDLANYTNPRTTNEGRYAETTIYNGQLDARWVTPIKRFPVTVKFGGKWNEENFDNGNETSYYTWTYIGPGGNTLTGYNATGQPTFTTNGTWAAYPSKNIWSTGTPNILSLYNSAGVYQPNSIPRPDMNAIAALQRDHPEWFVNNATADNYYNAFIAPKRDIVQTVTAGYGMADIRVSQALSFRTGVRWEKTENVAKEFDPLTNKEVRDAGFPVNTAARPTTIEGMQYQYFTNPRIERKKTYDDFFPMISMKYYILKDLEFQFGVNKAISRPPIDSLTGAWLINEDAQLITSPNPFLLPEYSKNYASRLSYFISNASQVSIQVNQNNIRNLRATDTRSAEEFGLGDDPEYGSYRFQAQYNVPNPVRFRSMELAYRQTLPFRSEALRGITLGAAYTRAYADSRRANLLPHRVTTTLDYSYRRLRARMGVVWRDDTPGQGTDVTYGLYRRHDTKLDISGEFRLNKYASLFFSGRNIFNDGQTWMQGAPNRPEGEGAAVRVYENYGANWNFGVKGTF